MSHNKLAYDTLSGEVSLLAATDDSELLAQMLALNTPGGHAVIDAPNLDSLIGVTVDLVNAEPVVSVIAPAAKTLAETKQAKRFEIERARDLSVNANVTTHGRQWQADERSQKLLSSAITLASSGLPLPAQWRDAANVNMPITALSDLLAIAGAMATQTQNAYSKSWIKKAEIDAATTITQVEAITW